MLAGPMLTLLLFGAEPGHVEPSAAAQAELERCAVRIEALKSRRQTGRELDRLLRRAQELEAALERAAANLPPPTPAAPSPEELRERADAARDTADRISAEIAALDVRIEDARRGRAELGTPIARAGLGTGTMPTGGERVRALLGARAALVEQRAQAVAEASRLDAEARAAEGIP
jgi:prefoldin subunit 5